MKLAVRSRIRVLSAFGALTGMLPGFVLPFVVSIVFTSTEADAYLISFAISLTLWNVVVNNLELNTVAEVGGRIAACGTDGVSKAMLTKYRGRALLYAAAVSVPAGGLLTAVYGAGLGFTSEYLVASLLAVMTCLVGAVSSVYSGLLIANSRSVIAVASQGARGFFAVIAAVSFQGGAIWIVTVFMLFGEFVRLILLSRCSRRHLSSDGPDMSLKLGSVGWQSASTSVAQGSPVIDRSFLSTSEPGSIAAYEIADKVFFAVVQFVNLGVLVRLVGEWSTIASVAPGKRRGVVVAGLARLSMVAAVASLLLCVVITSAILLGLVPDEWLGGVRWSLLLLASAPLALLNSGYGRILILIGRQRMLIYFATLSVLSNLILDVFLFHFLGSLGIVVASVFVRLFNVSAYVIYFKMSGWRCLEALV